MNSVNNNKLVTKIYKVITRVNNGCNSENLIQFYRVHAYQGALEALLSFYVVQIWLLFSPYFLTDSLVAGDTRFFYFIGTSFMLSIFIFVIYMLIVIVMFTRTINNNIPKETNVEIDLYIKYKKVKKEMRKTSRRIHIIGFLSYTIMAFLLSWVFNFVTNEPYKNYLCFVVTVGIICGFMWNFQDYFADNRLNFCSIFLEFSSLNKKQKIEIEEDLFKNTVVHAALSLGTLFIVLFSVFMILKVVHNVPDDVPNNAQLLFEGNFIQNAYILLFISIIVIYAKTVFSLYYQKKEKVKKIYLSIDEFGKKEEKK